MNEKVIGWRVVGIPDYEAIGNEMRLYKEVEEALVAIYKVLVKYPKARLWLKISGKSMWIGVTNIDEEISESIKAAFESAIKGFRLERTEVIGTKRERIVIAGVPSVPKYIPQYFNVEDRLASIPLRQLIREVRDELMIVMAPVPEKMIKGAINDLTDYATNLTAALGHTVSSGVSIGTGVSRAESTRGFVKRIGHTAESGSSNVASFVNQLLQSHSIAFSKTSLNEIANLLRKYHNEYIQKGITDETVNNILHRIVDSSMKTEINRDITESKFKAEGYVKLGFKKIVGGELSLAYSKSHQTISENNDYHSEVKENLENIISKISRVSGLNMGTDEIKQLSSRLTNALMERYGDEIINKLSNISTFSEKEASHDSFAAIHSRMYRNTSWGSAGFTASISKQLTNIDAQFLLKILNNRLNRHIEGLTKGMWWMQIFVSSYSDAAAVLSAVGSGDIFPLNIRDRLYISNPFVLWAKKLKNVQKYRGVDIFSNAFAVTSEEASVIFAPPVGGDINADTLPVVSGLAAPAEVHGDIYLGTALDESGREFCDYLIPGPRHTVVLGGTGTGKSDIIMRIIAQLRKKKFNILVLDPASDYRRLKRIFPEIKVINYGYDAWNPFIVPKNVSLHAWASAFATSFSIAFGLFQRCYVMLHEALLRKRPTSFSQLLKALREIHQREIEKRPDDEFLDKAMGVFEARLSVFEFDPGLAEKFKKPLSLSAITSGFTIIEQDPSLHGPLQNFLNLLLMHLLFYSRLRGWDVPIYLVVEETQRYIPPKGSSELADLLVATGENEHILARLVRESRKAGIFLITAAQNPSGLLPEIQANYMTLIVKRIPDAHEAIRAAEMLGSPEPRKLSRLITRLPTNIALARITHGQRFRSFNPVMLKLESFKDLLPLPSDEEIGLRQEV